MRIKIDPKKELFKWGPIDFKLIYASVFIEAQIGHYSKALRWHWPPCLSVMQQGRMAFIAEDLALRRRGLKFFKYYFLSRKNYYCHWQKWENWIKKYELISQELGNIRLGRLNSKELLKILKKFYQLNIDFWVIVSVPEIANWGGEYFLKRELEKKFGEKGIKYLEVLSAPVGLSFFQKEELDLFSLALIKDRAKFKRALKEHTRKYYWLLNSYGGNRVLGEKYFTKRLKRMLGERGAYATIKEIRDIVRLNQSRKQRLIKKLRLSKKLILVANQLSQSIWWQDLRKSYIWKLNYHWDQFLRIVTLETSWKFGELQWCYIPELLAIMKGDKRTKKSRILRRMEYYAVYAEEGEIHESYSKEAIQKLVKNYLEVKIPETRIIKGLTVSRKESKIVIRGRVKIVLNPFRDQKKMNEGNILVASMTSPEFIVVMRKAGAVITDHGGMTCHAAIVSRELKIPCIVGTKIATKVLKDGDLVEVDADRGIVKIINKK